MCPHPGICDAYDDDVDYVNLDDDDGDEDDDDDDDDDDVAGEEAKSETHLGNRRPVVSHHVLTRHLMMMRVMMIMIMPMPSQFLSPSSSSSSTSSSSSQFYTEIVGVFLKEKCSSNVISKIKDK